MTRTPWAFAPVRPALFAALLCPVLARAGDLTFSEAPDVEGELAAASPSPAEPEGGAIEEVLVWGRLEVKAARADVVRAMRELGWTPKKKGETLLFLPPESWMGKARLLPDGQLVFGRPTVAFKEAGVATTTPHSDYASLDRTGAIVLVSEADVAAGSAPANKLGAASPAVVPTATFYVLPSERKLASVHLGVLSAVGPQLVRYHKVMEETSFREELDRLPVRLDALWTDGVPLLGAAPRADAAARRADALAYWASREDSPRGLLETERVEDWFLATVMGSDQPPSAEELAVAEARRADGRRFPGR